MAEPTKFKFEFRIVKCEELKFKMDISSSVPIEKKKLVFNFGFRVIPVEGNKVSIAIAVRFLMGDAEIMYHESSSTYEFRNISDVMAFSENGKVNDKVNILPTLFSIAYSNARGMIAVRTAGGPLCDYPIPIVNPTEILNKAKQ